MGVRRMWRDSPNGSSNHSRLRNCWKPSAASPGHSHDVESPLRPVQELVQEVERSLPVNGVGPDEPFDCAAVADAESGFVQVADFGELVANGFIGCDAV